jgi:hypothetical protein
MKQILEKPQAIQMNQIKKLVLTTLSELGLTEMKIRQLVKQPILEAFEGMSEDKKWHIDRIVVTNIKPASYKKKILEGAI